MAATMRSSNPAFKEETVQEYLVADAAERKTMTVGGTAFKTFILLAFLIAGGAYGWASATQPVGVDLGQGYGNTTVTIPGGFWIISLITLFVGIFVSMRPMRAAPGAIVYAVLEGYLLGVISAAFDAQTEGIVGAAILATICVFFAALFMYVTRLVRPTQKMAFFVAVSIGGLLLLYTFVWILAIFDWSWLYSDEFRSVGIIVTLFTVGLAALSLVLDFGTIEGGVEAGAPKQVEWYCGFGLMVTLVWLYITILKLLALVARNQ